MDWQAWAFPSKKRGTIQNHGSVLSADARFPPVVIMVCWLRQTMKSLLPTQLQRPCVRLLPKLAYDALLGRNDAVNCRAVGARAVNSRAAIEDVRQAALRLVRNLPEAHIRVERRLRDLLFSRNAKAFVKRLYTIEATNYIDRDFEEIEDIARAGLRILQVYMVDLEQPHGSGPRKNLKAIQALAANLQRAIEGIERGLPPIRRNARPTNR